MYNIFYIFTRYNIIAIIMSNKLIKIHDKCLNEINNCIFLTLKQTIYIFTYGN